MDIETFRWFMSTVAQTLGALTAIVVAVYVMWIKRLREMQEHTNGVGKQFFLDNFKEASSVISKHGYGDYLDFFQSDIDDAKINTRRDVERTLLRIRSEYRRINENIKEVQSVWRPIFISIVIVILCFGFLGLDKIIIPNNAINAWPWVYMGFILLLVIPSMYLYFRFMFEVIAPFYPKHSFFKRIIKGLFNRNYPYDQD